MFWVLGLSYYISTRKYVAVDEEVVEVSPSLR